MAFTIGAGAFNPFKKIAVRAPVNEYDKSTLVNIYPKEFHERKLTLMPSDYYIPAGSFEKPSILVIGPASWWREVNEDEPLLELSHPSPQLADSIVRDALNGMLGCDMSTKMPGFFWLPGVLSVGDVVLNHKKHLLIANQKQHAYFEELVKIADSLWARTNGNPLAIHQDAKMAAQVLGLEREWLKNFSNVTQNIARCVACGTMRNTDFPVCPTCKAVVDPEKAAALKLKFVE